MFSWYHSPETNQISDETIRSVTNRYLGVGETVFDILQGSAVNSSYFKRGDRRQEGR